MLAFKAISATPAGKLQSPEPVLRCHRVVRGQVGCCASRRGVVGSAALMFASSSPLLRNSARAEGPTSAHSGASPETGAEQGRGDAPPDSACPAGSIRVQVVSTDLGLGVESKLLRHLGLRFGSESGELKLKGNDFTEVHFGPGAGDFQDGFLNTGSGMVADSEYMEIQEAGCTTLTIPECVEWCKKWADGKLYVTVGQNCWTMVGEFLENHEGTYMPDSVKFKEKQVNGWTSAFVDAAQSKADTEGVEVGQVWERIMKNPSEIFPEIMAAIAPDSLAELFPESLEQAAENISQAKDAATAAATDTADAMLDELTSQVSSAVSNVTTEMLGGNKKL